MDNLDLANKENELYSIVLETHGTMEDKSIQLRDKGVYDKYKQIHSLYADNSDKDLESLKRGLFIQWYAMTEPSCFTGINEIDLEAERKIINELDRLITTDNLDNELKWMLKYYSTWDFMFERFQEYKGLQDWIKKQMGTDLLNTVDKNEMENRGQMGKYWNSINKSVK